MTPLQTLLASLTVFLPASNDLLQINFFFPRNKLPYKIWFIRAGIIHSLQTKSLFHIYIHNWWSFNFWYTFKQQMKGIFSNCFDSIVGKMFASRVKLAGPWLIIFKNNIKVVQIERCSELKGQTWLLLYKWKIQHSWWSVSINMSQL